MGVAAMNTVINVGLVGFSNLDTIKLEKILNTTSLRTLRYHPVEEECEQFCDIVMANADDFKAIGRAKKRTVASGQKVKLVLVGSETKTEFMADNAFDAFLNKPIIGVRVISFLDTLTGGSHEPLAEENGSHAGNAITVNINIENQLFINTKPDLPEVLPSIHGSPDALRVLVIDDSVLIQKMLASELLDISRPVSVDFANSGEMALELIETQPEYHLIFLDIVMPGIDGYETCKRIRQYPHYRRNKPIIMLSSKSSPVEQLTGYAAGCTNFLAKPIVPADFHYMLERVSSWVEDRVSFKQASPIHLRQAA
jgi:twitching motility two-component system response regulator PilG